MWSKVLRIFVCREPKQIDNRWLYYDLLWNYLASLKRQIAEHARRVPAGQYHEQHLAILFPIEPMAKLIHSPLLFIIIAKRSWASITGPPVVVWHRSYHGDRRYVRNARWHDALHDVVHKYLIHFRHYGRDSLSFFLFAGCVDRPVADTDSENRYDRFLDILALLDLLV